MNPTPASSPTRSGRAKGLARIVLAAGTCAALAWHFAVPHPNRAAAQVGLSPTPTRAPTPTATAVAEPGLCSVVGEQRADAAQVEVKQPLGMRFHLRAVCPDDVRGRADILLLIDNSASMTEGGKWGAAKAAVLEFITRVDFDRNRVGLVPFNSSAYVAQPLTFNQDYLTRALAALPAPQNNTDIAAAITLADKELSLVGRREAVHILVVLTDGQSSAEAMHAAAGRARARGVVLFAIGLGADAAQDELRKLADSPSHYYFAPGPEALAEIYTRIASLIREVLVTDVVVVDRLGQADVFAHDKREDRFLALGKRGQRPAVERVWERAAGRIRIGHHFSRCNDFRAPGGRADHNMPGKPRQTRACQRLNLNVGISAPMRYSQAQAGPNTETDRRLHASIRIYPCQQTRKKDTWIAGSLP